MSKQFGIKEVVNCWLRNYSTEDPICYVDYASDSSFMFKSDRLDLRGGQGNYKLLSFDHTKDGTMKLELPLVDLSLLGSITGEDVTVGAATVPNREVLTVNASHTVTLASTPTSGSVKVWILEGTRDYGTEQTSGTPASTPNTFSISGKVITLNATSAPENTKVICEYTYTSAATTRTITFKANKFPPYMAIDGIGKWTDENTGEVKDVVFEVLKAKPKDNVELTQKSTDATKLTLEFDLYTELVGTDRVYVNIYELA